MDASIIIPSYKSEQTIEQCLGSLLRQVTEHTYEVIVVDSSSRDCVDSIVKKVPRVKFIKLEKKTYAGIARNIGADEACGELLIFLDADVRVGEGWLERVFRYYRSGHDIFSSAIDIWEEKSTFVNRLEWFFEFSEFKPTMKEGTRWCLPAAALAVTKDIFINEKFNNMRSSEDVELSVRLRNKGNVLYFNPCLKSFHIFQNSFIGLLDKAFDFGFTNMHVRKIRNLSGSYFVRKPFLNFFVIPGFAFVKLLKISLRNLAYNSWKDKMLYICLLPGMLVLILIWSIGAYKAIIAGENIVER